MVTRTLERDTAFEVVGTAPNGVLALQRIAQLEPDIVVLDVEMPEMDGIETLRRIRARNPQLKVVMFSTLTERGAAVTIEALTLGASDYATKAPGSGGESSEELLRNGLLAKLKQFFPPGYSHRAPLAAAPAPAAGAQATLAARPPAVAPRMSECLSLPRTAAPPEVILIGVSTGGPTALHEIMPEFPAGFAAPVLIVQHMPPLFTRLLAERLAARARIPVVEAAQGMPVEPGTAYIAPGDYHMRVAGQPGRVRITLDQGPQENSCRPAVDALFRSAGEVWGPTALGLILTGMGSDGLLGCESLRARGAHILAQDEATSVVWGMPGFVARAGLADRVLPLREIVPEILSRFARPVLNARGSFPRLMAEEPRSEGKGPAPR